jgi:hypothetical protein
MKTTILIGLLSLALFCIPSTYGQMNEWTRQFGTSNNDISFGVSADGLGNVYISGETDGNLEGTRAGSFDAFITKYNANGTLQWTQQFGTSEWDIATGVSADGLGNVYISGYTAGTLEGTNALHLRRASPSSFLKS